MPRIRLVTFDLDNTLWNVQTGHWECGAALGRLAGMIMPPARSRSLPQKRGHQRHAHRPDRRPARSSPMTSPVCGRKFSACCCAGPAMGVRRLSGWRRRRSPRFLRPRHEVEFFDGALDALAALSRRYVLGLAHQRQCGPEETEAGPLPDFQLLRCRCGRHEAGAGPVPQGAGAQRRPPVPSRACGATIPSTTSPPPPSWACTPFGSTAPHSRPCAGRRPRPRRPWR